MIAATGNPTYRAGFGPEVPGFIHVDGGDFDALTKAIDDETAGITHGADPGRRRHQHLPRRLSAATSASFATSTA